MDLKGSKIAPKILAVEMLLTERENIDGVILLCLLGVGDILWNQSV